MYVFAVFIHTSLLSIRQDIDVVVLSTAYSQEQLKRLLCNTDSNFYTVASKDPYATYRVLWYRLSGYGRKCKVDILQPGIMNIPSVPDDKVVYLKSPQLTTSYRSLPLMPFIPLLLLKLQAWEDHGKAAKLYMRAKQPTDVSDIRELLTLASRMEPVPKLDTSTEWVPDSFMAAGKLRVKRFVARHNDTANGWRRLGFTTGLTSLLKARGNTKVNRGVDDVTNLLGGLSLEYW